MGQRGEDGGSARSGTIPYTALVQQFNEAPPGKLYMLHGSPAVFRLSLSAAAHVLLQGIPLTLVDGTNRFDLYYLAEFARRFGMRYGGVTPEELLQRIFVSRAFTCYQMEALITNRLPAFVQRSGSPIVVIFGLVDTFYDEQAPLFEVRGSLRRVLVSLDALKRDGISVLLASDNCMPATPDRNGLLPMIAAGMDRVFRVTEAESQVRIEPAQAAGLRPPAVQRKEKGDGKNRSDIHDGHPAGDGKLDKVPARIAQGRPGGV